MDNYEREVMHNLDDAVHDLIKATATFQPKPGSKAIYKNILANAALARSRASNLLHGTVKSTARWAGYTPEAGQPVAATKCPPSADRGSATHELVSATMQLLKCAELNQDDLEPGTRANINRVRDAVWGLVSEVATAAEERRLAAQQAS